MSRLSVNDFAGGSVAESRITVGGRDLNDLEWDNAEDDEINAWVARETAAQIAELEADPARLAEAIRNGYVPTA